jgi:hypothetical protein
MTTERLQSPDMQRLMAGQAARYRLDVLVDDPGHVADPGDPPEVLDA